MKFSELNLDPVLFQNISQLGYVDCTPIQEQSIPVILQGKDLAGLAQTGTGKTAAFLVPLIHRMQSERDSWLPRQFVLILVPTRELAEQVLENAQKFLQGTSLRGVCIYGGTGYEKQKEALKNGVEFVIATPGRLIDLYKEHMVDLKQVKAIVFDEADRMFDMGFKDDMKYILQRVPKDRQFLVFSATLNFDVLNTAYQFGAEPVEINISREQTKAENVKDVLYHVGSDEKPQHLLSLLVSEKPQQAIIFTNFKNNVESLAKFLMNNGIPAVALSSLLSQSQRNRVIEQFKAKNDINVLVATDVAARGLDIQGVDLVINYELPSDSESYVHRIGRTGRAGLLGKACSLVSDKDIDALQRIEDYLKHKIEVAYLEDSQLLKDFKPFYVKENVRTKDFKSHSKPYKKASSRHPVPASRGVDSQKSISHQKSEDSAHLKNRSNFNKTFKAKQSSTKNFRKPHKSFSNSPAKQVLDQKKKPLSLHQKIQAFFRQLFKKNTKNTSVASPKKTNS